MIRIFLVVFVVHIWCPLAANVALEHIELKTCFHTIEAVAFWLAFTV